MSQFLDDACAFYLGARNRVRRAVFSAEMTWHRFLDDEGKNIWDRSFSTEDIDLAIKDLQHAKAELESAERQARLAKEAELQERSS